MSPNYSGAIASLFPKGVIAPCPCVADGIMIATTSTPGQNLLRVATTASPEGTFGVAEIRDR